MGDQVALGEKTSVEVITAFTVVVGRGGRPYVLPLGMAASLDLQRDPDSRDIQASCREISDDLLAYRAAEYSENPTHMAAIADILGEISARSVK